MAIIFNTGVGNDDAGLNGGGGPNGRDFIDNVNGAVSAGTLETIDILVSGTPTVKVKVWRLNGANYDFVGQSTLPALSNGLNNDVALNTPIALQAGDFLGLHVAAGVDTIRVKSASPDQIVWDAADSDYTTNQPTANFSTTFAFAFNVLGEGTLSGGDSVTVTDIQTANQKSVSTNDKSIAFSGTYTGTPTGLARRAEYADNQETISDWTTFDGSPTGNAFSGSVTVPASVRPINVLVRFTNDVGVNDKSNNFYVGDFVIIAGESTARDMGLDGTATPNTGVFDWNSGTGALTTPSTGAGQITLANTINTQTNHAVFIKNVGVGGTALLSANNPSNYLWEPSNPTSRPQYADIVNTFNAAGDIPCLYFNIGANDAYVSATDKATLTAAYAAFFTRLRTDTKANLPIIASLTGRHLGTPASQQGWTDDLLAQKDAYDADANVHYSTFYDQGLKDDVHPNVAGYTETGIRLANAALSNIYSSAQPYSPPTISSVVVTSPTQTTFNLTRAEGSDITPSLNITDVALSADGFTSSISISSVSRVNATSFIATHASATVTHYRYNWGAAPNITGIVKDNSARTLPLIQSEGSVVAASSTLNITVTGIPDGSFMTVLDNEDGSRIQRQNETYSSGVLNITLPIAPGTRVKGYVDDAASPSANAAYLEGVTS